jgi:putative ABC transport system substrate-binding protein
MIPGQVDGAGIERVVSEIVHRPGGGLMTIPDFFTGVHRDLIIALTARYRVPAVYHYRFFFNGRGSDVI